MKEIFMLLSVLNAVHYSWQWDVQIRLMPVPFRCSSDSDCLKGEAKCLQGECHCTNPVSRGDGKLGCETHYWYRCSPNMEKHCQSSALFANSHCLWSFHYGRDVIFCKCNDGHFGRAGVIGCLKAGDDPNGKRPCLGNNYCPILSVCNAKTKRCQCKPGLVGNGVTCRPAPGRKGCKTNNDCKSWSYCKDSICHCKEELQGDGITCNPAPRKTCRTKKDCHSFARCMNGYCVCDDSAGNGQYCRKGWTTCTPNPCGFNNQCAVDPLHPHHKWCMCKIGTDQRGNCVECFSDKDCAEIKGKCENNKCKCREELYLSHNRCVPNRSPHPCKTDKHCHRNAKCDEGKCVCEGRRLGNGRFCRDGTDCAWFYANHCRKGGICLSDPLMEDGNYGCKCYKGWYYEFPWGCIECKGDHECPVSATCHWRHRYCQCKDELIKLQIGKKCVPAPVQTCKTQEQCHAKAKCFFGKCICQGNTTGNGKFCRDAVPCSKETLSLCGDHASCIADPYLPHIPICRCFKGFKLSKENNCVDVDECKTLKSRCGNRCRNTIGSFYCSNCPAGYTETPSGGCIAPCDCGKNEECQDGECVCVEGYDRDEFGECFWPESELLLVDKGISTQAFSPLLLVALGLLGYQAILV